MPNNGNRKISSRGTVQPMIIQKPCLFIILISSDSIKKFRSMRVKKSRVRLTRLNPPVIAPLFLKYSDQQSRRKVLKVRLYVGTLDWLHFIQRSQLIGTVTACFCTLFAMVHVWMLFTFDGAGSANFFAEDTHLLWKLTATCHSFYC